MTTDNAPSNPSNGDPALENVIKTELHLPSILGYEKIARGAAQALAEQIDLPPERIEDLKTAVAEACMNAIEHGNDLQSTIHVTVMMLIADGKLEVRVADVGLQVIPDALPEPGTSAPMRGWGMFFIKNLVDEMEIKRLPDGGNEVRMVIHMAPAKEDSTAEVTDSTSSAIQPAEQKPSAVTPTEQKPSAIQVAEQKPGAVTPVEQKPSAVTPAEPKPSAIQAAEQKPSAIIPTQLTHDTQPEAKSDSAEEHSSSES